MEHLEDIFVPLSFFAAVVLTFYFYFKSRHAERMALIEKGLYHIEKKPVKFNSNWIGLAGLTLGIILASLGLGTIVAYLLCVFTIIDHDIAFLSMLLVFGGCGIIFSYFVLARKNKLEE